MQPWEDRCQQGTPAKVSQKITEQSSWKCWRQAAWKSQGGTIPCSLKSIFLSISLEDSGKILEGWAVEVTEDQKGRVSPFV